MVSLCIDKGNTRIKIGVFDDDQLLYENSYKQLDINDIHKITNMYLPEACILCNVGGDDEELIKDLQSRFENFVFFDYNTPIPITNRYSTPKTLGKDRLAAVIGAVYLKPNADILVVDAGTAITYDFVDAGGIYHGGNIAPGLKMRIRALHEFTEKLPLVEIQEIDGDLGKDTNSAILLGAIKGIEFEIKGYFNTLNFKYPELSIFLTGGNANYFVSKLKSPIFAQKNLVLTGLNRILQFNVKK